jgi:hypothetical protein
MFASLLRRTEIATARRVAELGCCHARHAMVIAYQRVAIWLTMMAMVGIVGLAIAIGLHGLRSLAPLLSIRH